MCSKPEDRTFNKHSAVSESPLARATIGSSPDCSTVHLEHLTVNVNWAGVIAPAVSVLCLDSLVDSLAVSAMNVVLSTPYEVGVVRQMC